MSTHASTQSSHANTSSTLQHTHQHNHTAINSSAMHATHQHINTVLNASTQPETLQHINASTQLLSTYQHCRQLTHTNTSTHQHSIAIINTSTPQHVNIIVNTVINSLQFHIPLLMSISSIPFIFLWQLQPSSFNLTCPNSHQLYVQSCRTKWLGEMHERVYICRMWN
jgi:hypothetical protein